MTTARREVTITYAGAVDGENVFTAPLNVDSPAVIELKNLAAGFNAIAAPYTPAGGRPSAVTIIPPADNEVTLNACAYSDATATGVPLHPTEPSSIALAPSALPSDGTPGGFGLIAGGAVSVRLFWS